MAGKLVTEWEAWRQAAPTFITLHTRDAFDAAIFYGGVLLDVALDLTDGIVGELSRVTGYRRCTYAGSLHRVRETIGDIDVLVASEKSAPLMKAFHPAAVRHDCPYERGPDCNCLTRWKTSRAA